MTHSAKINTGIVLLLVIVGTGRESLLVCNDVQLENVVCCHSPCISKVGRPLRRTQIRLAFALRMDYHEISHSNWCA